MKNNHRKWAAESIGTFWLVFAGCGSAVIAAGTPGLGIGYLGVSLAFGLSVVTMAYAFAEVSGAHFNPAVTLGLAAAGRFQWNQVGGYVLAQLVGAIIAAGVLYLIATGVQTFNLQGGFAANGYGTHSPGGYTLAASFLAEAVLSFIFLMVILGATDSKSPRGFAPLAIGLTLTLIHLVSIPITNTSVNPARSTGPALFVGGWAMGQLWLFWVAPLMGALSAGMVYSKVFLQSRDESPTLQTFGLKTT